MVVPPSFKTCISFISFEYIPLNCKFRSNGKWLTKTSWCLGVDKINNKESFIIARDKIVGIRRTFVPSQCKKNIIKNYMVSISWD